MSQESEREAVLDVVCGTGVRPEEAIARAFEGETYYFCCQGCAEAFERNPAAYLAEKPIRAYRVQQKATRGPDLEKVREAEARAAHFGPDVAAADQRARSAREGVDRLQRDLEDARARFVARRDEMLALGRREEELRAMPEAAQVSDLEQRVQREQPELQAAERALAKARSAREASLLRQRAEAGSLEERQKMLQAEVKAEQQRAGDLQDRVSQLDKLRAEWEDARARLAQRRDELAMLARQEEELRARPGGPDVEALRQRIGADQAELQATGRALAEAGGREEGMAATPEARRAAEYGQRLAQARADLEEAQRKLNEARMRVEAIQPARPADIAELETRRLSVEMDLRAQELRVRDLDSRIGQLDSLRAELGDSQARLAKQRADMEALGKRDAEIRAALSADEQRLAGLQQQVMRERSELEEAQRELAGAQVRTEETLRAQRAELADIKRRRESRELGAEEKRVKDLEARIKALENEAKEADRRAAELRTAEKAAQDEIDRLRTETRKIVLEGLPAVPGEEPRELYVAERNRRQQGQQGR